VRGTARGGVAVVDDFAHHPTRDRDETLAALRARLGPGARILAVLEPRSNTMKQGVWKGELAASLADADAVFCSRGLGSNTAGTLAPLGRRLTASEDLAVLVAAIAGEARDGDTVLVMSNGGFEGIHDKLLAALAA
jgi:UDP-N-acetylmuramate: L-alanyl-gamma-D-glutamyl-meso-diaminopimelate ligase